MTKSERERRKVEIVNSFGANSGAFNKVKAIEMGHTFREQGKNWFATAHDSQTEARQTSNRARVGESYNQSQPAHRGYGLAPHQQRHVEDVGREVHEAGLSPRHS